MTFCTQCGTDNNAATKYCRECGKRLQTPELEPVGPPSPSVNDAVAGEILYKCFQLYEDGKLDEAANHCRQVLAMNPRSSSAHALLSMVYEKRAEAERSSGDIQAARDCLMHALRERERVLQLSPGSVADAQKLKELKRRLYGKAGQEPGPSPRTVSERLKGSAKCVPVPVLMSLGVAVLVFLIVLAFLNSGNRGKSDVGTAAANRPQQEQSTPQPVAGQQYSYSSPQQSVGDKEPADDATLDFIAPESESAPSPSDYRSIPTPVTTSPTVPVPRITPPSVKLPRKLDVSDDIQVLPLDGEKKSPSPEPRSSGSVPVKPFERTTESGQVGVVIAPAEKTGTDYQREAISLLNQGRKDEAAQSFKKAIEAYNEQIARGMDPDAANAGIRTCKSYLEILRK